MCIPRVRQLQVDIMQPSASFLAAGRHRDGHRWRKWDDHRDVSFSEDFLRLTRSLCKQSLLGGVGSGNFARTSAGSDMSDVKKNNHIWASQKGVPARWYARRFPKNLVSGGKECPRETARSSGRR